jgi:Lar family restriction alleviation protein
MSINEVVNIELLPCPFCGNCADIAQDQSSDYQSHWTWFVECTGCGAMISIMETKQQAVNAWNLRPFNAKLSRAGSAQNETTDGKASD